MNFICPVCRNTLFEEEKLYRCEKGHCFDKSKFGYVNLLQSQKSSAKRHGDDRVMIRARRDFLDGDYYGFLRDEIFEVCNSFLENGSCVIDAGCGEGWYSSGIKQKLLDNGKNVSFYGVDISKDALEFASKRKSGIPAAVASVFDLPFADASADLLLNIFSPEADGEYCRVLKKGGIMIRVIPLERHLFELKAAIYDKPYLNDIPKTDVEGFTVEDIRRISGRIRLLSNEAIQNLFRMTPYYYKTGADDQQKINNIDCLETGAEFEIRIYRKD
ncbi:MAG: methyltransferase domain-containing protein [Clostridia bacterium]|nr:methyltransferase domain-containing protein [Clostridia bacterium]